MAPLPKRKPYRPAPYVYKVATHGPRRYVYKVQGKRLQVRCRSGNLTKIPMRVFKKSFSTWREVELQTLRQLGATPNIDPQGHCDGHYVGDPRKYKDMIREGNYIHLRNGMCVEVKRKGTEKMLHIWTSPSQIREVVKTDGVYAIVDMETSGDWAQVYLIRGKVVDLLYKRDVLGVV